MNRQQIKLLAISAMTIDHIALVFVPTSSILYYVMRLIGRLTAPMMAFMLTEGYRHTRSRSRYLLRLVIFALISQPFYFRMLFGRATESVLEYITHWNVMFTLAVALMSLMLLESKIPIVPRLILVGVCISLAQFGDWSYMILVWAIIFHAFRDDKRRSAALFIIVSLVLQTAIWLIIPRSGKHQSAERKTSFHDKENTNPHKESSNPLMESTSCIIIELEA